MALFRQLFLAFLCYLIVIIYVEDAQGFPKQKSSSKSLQNKVNEIENSDIIYDFLSRG